MSLKSGRRDADERHDTTGETEHDQLFAHNKSCTDDFRFNAATASVFDDMVDRSVPFYAEMQRMACEIARDFAQPNSSLLDLGCATGTTLLAMDRHVEDSLRFVGIDDSQAMLDQAQDKFRQGGVTRPYDLVCADLHGNALVQDASIVLMLLTLQFIRPLYRERVMHRIHEGMHDNGCLILIEKLTVGDSLINRLFIHYYYDMKRRHGYSDLEIANKREALENVLIPYREEENRDLLLGAGFRHVETFFRWYNFCGVLAVK